MNLIIIEDISEQLRNMPESKIMSFKNEAEQTIGIMKNAQEEFSGMRLDGCINRMTAFLDILNTEIKRRSDD